MMLMIDHIVNHRVFIMKLCNLVHCDIDSNVKKIKLFLSKKKKEKVTEFDTQVPT